MASCSRQTTSRIIYWGSGLGFLLTFPAWLLGWISGPHHDRITLALSFLALILEARNGIRIDDN
jgi:hypothetical protein